MAPRTARLSAQDWTRGALDLLMAEGVAALQINRLCADLGVTRGSFYWHFADLTELEAAVAERWCEETRERLDQLAELDRLPPRERLRIMTLHLIDDASWSVERALREWARSTPQVAAVVGESDQHVFELVERAIVELGHDPTVARTRAGLLVYAGIGFAHGQSTLPKPTEADVDQLLDFLAEPAS
ncbi:MAG: TetR/AcrR family transcriptional regulator [Aeromicrobium sp.]|uniref:TetR/AcrR family transcriptional regulator n=1 Tax=Aeromicrobium sp. TaxID=1871063 RepID=UPI0025BA7894|nr:TetR/AcrR family transcriptional regulator [Aeromicrobium sp.]MCK5892095.1 TetR/AcrR family transcriptional regulator [Aeromicrobium sp.]MDF1704246.1 TetR/AcrR family transcriptional regulator [Aeromicrobium sp.]